jgi:beta-lactamase regulating signal transducer with metallopeptidase domain
MNWLPCISVCVQITLVAALGLLAAALARSAAHRHNILLAALLCMLAGPVFYAAAARIGFSIALPVVFPSPRGLPQEPSIAPTELSKATLDIPQNSVAQDAGEPSIGPLTWQADVLLAAVWLSGTLLCLAGVLRSLWKTRGILNGARLLHEEIHPGIVAEAERQLGAPGLLQVGTTGKVAGPFVVGVLRPWILIPARYLEALSRAELLQVLIHEGAHALRRDPLLALVQRICGALFWWHPLVHLVNRQLTRAREEVCDNFVLAHVAPETYGATLLRLATLSPVMARVSLAIGMFDGRGKLEDRIRGLLDTSRKTMTRVPFRTSAAVLSAFALFSVVVASAGVVAGDPNDAPPDAPIVAPNALDVPTVVGTVVSPEGQPVAGIEVLAFRGGKQLAQKFTTDEKGQFRVPRAWREAEEWLTVVARDGRARLGWFDFMFHGHSDLGQKSYDGSFRLVLLPVNRTIRGRVVDEAGQPLAQIPVRINQLVHDVNLTAVHWRYQKLAGEPLVLGAVTGDDGRYELKLPASTFAWLGASHPDWVERPIRVTKEQDEVAEAKLVRAAKVAGRVIDSRTGKPLAGVGIGAYAARTELFESGGDEAKTDANGNYLIQGLRGGKYTIQLLQGAEKTLTAPAYKALLRPGVTFPADFSLSIGRRLSGRVLDIETGEPIASCKVTYTGPARPGAGLSTETNTLGEFVFFVPPGRSHLDATEGRRFGNDSTRVVDVSPDSDPEPVVLKVGEQLETVPGSFRILTGAPKIAD